MTVPKGMSTLVVQGLRGFFTALRKTDRNNVGGLWAVSVVNQLANQA